ncbi:hypothetical protein F5Y16DRAFT_35315 [Xylariaceae sp. FL0255]|nr:hypothetical protein F5Y16DRAFT_35315 [Xylariaceae sp. FL0255]
MSSRRPNSSRRSESTEPQEGLGQRQTRSSARLAGISEVTDKSKNQFEVAQRGTRRKTRKKSVESIATNDYRDSSIFQQAMENDTSEEVEVAPEDVLSEGVERVPSDQSDLSFLDGLARLEDMLDFDLPKLDRWCDKSYSAVKALSQPQPTEDELKDFRTARKFFRVACHAVTGDESNYIDAMLLNLPYNDSPDARDAVQEAIRLGNLISLLLSVVHVQNTGQGMSPFIRELDEAFHTFFDQDFSGDMEAHELAFRVRSYRLLELLEEQPDSDPFVLASTLFCKQPAATREEARSQLQSGPFKELGGVEKDVTPDSRQAAEEQMVHLSTALSLSEVDRVKLALSRTAPKDSLLEALRSWSLHMYESLKEKSSQNDQHPPQSTNQPDQTVQTEEENLFVDADGDEPMQESQAASDLGSEHYQTLPATGALPALTRESTSLTAIRDIERGTAAPSRNQAHNGQTDSQARNAIRQLDPAQLLESLMPANNTAQKRVRPAGVRDEEEEDDDESDDFEPNSQLADEARRMRLNAPESPKRRSPKQARVGGNVPAAASRSATVDNNRPPQSSLEARDIGTLKARAMANRRAMMADRRPPQVRERWTNEDTVRLVDLISDPDLNCSWAAMAARAQERNIFSVPRGQQAIRDKARNLKTEYLQADAILPPGFDFIRLGQKERNRLIAAGYNPDRMEDDISDDSRVINSRLR